MFNHTHDKQHWANFPTNNSWVKFKEKPKSLRCRRCFIAPHPRFIKVKAVWHFIDAFMTVCSYQEMSCLEGHRSYRKNTHTLSDRLGDRERDMHAHTGFNKALRQAHSTQTQTHRDKYWLSVGGCQTPDRSRSSVCDRVQKITAVTGVKVH